MKTEVKWRTPPQFSLQKKKKARKSNIGLSNKKEGGKFLRWLWA